MPSLTGVAEAERRWTSAEPVNFSADYLRMAPGIQLSYLILNFGGGRQAAVEQALQEVYSANHTYNQAIQDAILEVELAYYSLCATVSAIDFADSTLQETMAALDAAKLRMENGTGAELDVLQAQAAYDRAQYAKAEASGRRKIAEGLLAKVLSLPANTSVAIAQPAGEFPGLLEIRDVRALIEDALSQRPDIASLRSVYKARLAATRVAAAGNKPSLHLISSAMQNTYETFGGKEFQDNDWNLGATLSLRWTIFDGFQTKNSWLTAMANAEASRLQLEEAEIAATAEVWNRYHSYETALEKHRASTAFLKSASKAHTMAVEAYESGLRSMIDRLNAEEQLSLARKQSVESRLEIFSALSLLSHATGKLSGNQSQTGSSPVINQAKNQGAQP